MRASKGRHRQALMPRQLQSRPDAALRRAVDPGALRERAVRNVEHEAGFHCVTAFRTFWCVFGHVSLREDGSSLPNVERCSGHAVEHQATSKSEISPLLAGR